MNEPDFHDLYFKSHLLSDANDIYRIIGSRLHQDDDLAAHFAQICDNLLSTVTLAENYCKINPEAARQVALAHLHCLFYYKASGMFTSITSLWQQTASFVSKIEANLDQNTSAE